MSSDLCSPSNCNICLLFNPQKETTVFDVGEKRDLGNLLPCSGCELIRYCSSQHQKVDWPIHEEFCKAVQKIKKELGVSHPFYISGVPTSKVDVEKNIIRIKYLLKAALLRKLEYQEEELTSFPASCGHCFKMKNLKFFCEICCNQMYCSAEHKELHKEEHARVCKLLQLYYCPYKVQCSYDDISVQFGARVKDLHKQDLFACIQNIFGVQLPANPCKNLLSYQMFSWAADFSCIMTICWAMEVLQYDKTTRFIIFIVGASIEAVLWFREVHCKLFFLQNPEILELELIFVGPEVVKPNYEELKFKFLGSKRLVQINIYKGLYQTYCTQYKVKPCLMIAFNCGFSEFAHSYNSGMAAYSEIANPHLQNTYPSDTWFGGLLEIVMTFQTPIVFTSFTEQESAFDFCAFLKAANMQRHQVHVDRIIKSTKNPYHDFRPLRQWFTDDEEDFYYRNGYVQAIRTTLKN